MSKSKDKGTAWETETVRVLQRHGAPFAERRALHGITDRGDITGLSGVVIEDKAEARQNIPGWLAELQAEMTNDGADLGLVWAKRVGRTSALDGYMILPPIVGLRLLAQAGYLDPEDLWQVTKEAAAQDADGRQALLDAQAVELATTYHLTVGPCTPDNCPGVLECTYAERLSLAGFRALAEVLA